MFYVPKLPFKNKRPFCSLTRCEPTVNIFRVALNDDMGLQLARRKGTWVLEYTTPISVV